VNTVPASAQRIALDLLRLDRRVFPRFKVDSERRRVFAELYEEGGAEALPPILLVTDAATGKYLVADGFTRVFAATDAGLAYVLAQFPPVRGDATPIENAYEVGLLQVATSGKPLSRAEQQEAILRVLDEHSDWSDAQIARLVGSTRQTVWRQRCIATTDQTDQPVERWATASVSADQIARSLARQVGRLWDARGLTDRLLGDRTGQRLAAALNEQFGDDAVEWAERFAGWAQRALDELRSAE
jgi:ParB-like chromosome segregation protein Spo0J